MLFEVIWKNIMELGRPQMIAWCMRIAYWIPKATNTHSDFFFLISFDQRSEYNVFHKLMSWQESSLWTTLRLCNIYCSSTATVVV